MRCCRSHAADGSARPSPRSSRRTVPTRLVAYGGEADGSVHVHAGSSASAQTISEASHSLVAATGAGAGAAGAAGGSGSTARLIRSTAPGATFRTSAAGTRISCDREGRAGSGSAGITARGSVAIAPSGKTRTMRLTWSKTVRSSAIRAGGVNSMRWDRARRCPSGTWSIDHSRFGVPTNATPPSLSNSAIPRTKANGSTTCSRTSELQPGHMTWARRRPATASSGPRRRIERRVRRSFRWHTRWPRGSCRCRRRSRRPGQQRGAVARPAAEVKRAHPLGDKVLGDPLVDALVACRRDVSRRGRDVSVLPVGGREINFGHGAGSLLPGASSKVVLATIGRLGWQAPRPYAALVVGVQPGVGRPATRPKPLTSQGSQVVKAAVCKTVYRWFDSIPWDHHIPRDDSCAVRPMRSPRSLGSAVVLDLLRTVADVQEDVLPRRDIASCELPRRGIAQKYLADPR